jgi:TolB-like protein
VTLRPLLLALVLLAALPAVALAEVTLALAPVEVHATGEDSAYLADGLGEMLSARLEQFEDLRVVRIDAPGDGAVAAGRAAGADYVLYGSFTRFGQGASLDLRCAATADGAGEPREVFIQAGLVSEIIPKLDTLAEKVARYAANGEVAHRRAGPPDAGATLADLVRRVEALEARANGSGAGDVAAE